MAQMATPVISKAYVLQRLAEFGLGEDFLTKLPQTDARITGSFPLQVILKEKYPGSDLDIFCHDKDYEVLKRFIGGNGYFTNPTNQIFGTDQTNPTNPTNQTNTAGAAVTAGAAGTTNQPHPNNPNNPTNTTNPTHPTNHAFPHYDIVPEDSSWKDIKNVITYFYTPSGLIDANSATPIGESHKIQFVILQDDVSIQDHISRFDMSICRISFDGTSITIPHASKTLQKVGIVSKGRPNYGKRLDKYKARGFELYQEI